MAGMFDDLVPGGSKPKAEQKTESGPWDTFKPQGQSEDGPWSAYQGGAFDDLIPKQKEKSSLLRRAVGDTAVSAVKGAIGLTEVPVGIADLATGGLTGKVLEDLGYRPKQAKEILDDMYSPEQKAANQKVQEAEGFVGTAKTALQNPSTIAHAVVESAPLLLPGAAVARGVGAAGKISPVVAGGIGEGVVGAGLAAEQMRQNSEDGLLSGRQIAASLASGAGTAAFGIAGGKVAQSAIGKKLGLADVDTALAMTPAQRAAAGGIDAGLAKRIAGGAVSEGVLEELPQSMWEQAAQNYGENKDLGEGVAEAGAMGMLAGGVMGGGFNALRGPQRKDEKPVAGAEESPLALPAPTYTGTPGDQTLAAEVERANQVAAAQANADQVYAERAAFEQQRAPEKLPVTGPLSAAVNVGIDSGATSITSPANPRYEIPATPRGSFSQQAELAQLINQEQADVADRRELAQLVSQERGDQVRRIAEASQRRQALEDALADADQRVAGAAAQESEAARLRLLDSVLADAGESGNPARQFGNALRRAGYRNTDFTEREQQTIRRFSDARAALNSPEATTVPAAPNELDPAAVGIRERAGDSAGAVSVPRDKVAEAVDLVSQGWKLSVGRRLVSPKGKVRNLNAAEFAAVKQARAAQSGGKVTSVEQRAETANAAGSGGEWSAFPADSGSLGVPRSNMPQIKAEHRGAMTQFMKARGVTHQQETVAADNLRPTQAEFSPAKVKKALGFEGGDRSILVSSDGYVLDGHHQWLAKREKGEAIDIIRFDAPIADLVELANEFPSSTNAAGATSGNQNPIKKPAPTIPNGDGITQEPAPTRQRTAAAPIMRRDDLVGAIMRVTGGNGIAANMAQTIIGDKANQATKVRGLFQNAGTMDLDDTADLLRTQEGYDVRDGNHLAELIREQADGNPVVSMERAEREAADNAEKEYRAAVNERAASMGLKQASGKRTLETVEADIARVEAEIEAKERELSEMEAREERAAIQAEAVYDEIYGADLSESDWMAWLSSRIAGAYTQEEIDNVERIQANREDASAAADADDVAGVEPQAGAGSRQGAGADEAQTGRTEGGARGVTEGFGLTQQTNEQAAEQFAQQQAGEDAEPTKAQADRERDAVPFSLGMQSQPSPQGVQAGLFTADGRASVAATAESKAEAASAAVDRAESVEPEAADDVLAITPTDKARTHGQEKRIADFGEKIGGARKDMAAPTGPRARVEKETDERPAWMRKIRVMQITAMPGRINQQNVGKWQIMEETGGMRGAVRALTSSRFDTEAEAMAAVPHVVVSKRHRVYSYKDRQGNVLFGVFRNITDRKRGLVRGGFASHAEAMEYLAQNPVAVIEHKFGYPERPWLDRIERIGANRLDGDVSTAMFQETFGFRAGEFGNWNMGGDGQAALNHAYEALLDLADAIGVPPKAISLNGQLAIAFGARGRGGKGSAAAHYEPDTMVINLTKIKGAGSLAHEWWHAVDDYFAKNSGRRQSNSVVANGYVQGNSQARPELIEAIKNVVDKMMFAETSRTTDADMIRDRAKKRIDEARNTIDYHNRDLRSMMTEGRYSRGNKTATAEQLAQWDVFIERLKAGDMGEMVYIENPSKVRGAMGFQTGTVLRDMNALYKSVTGRSFLRQDSQSTGRKLHWIVDSIKDNQQRVDVKEDTTETVKGRSSYFIEAKKIDNDHTSDYWSMPEEMGARAFESYIFDKIKEKGGRSDYLVHGVENRFYSALDMYPYPEGQEREAINQAFDNLFDTIQSRETERGVAMESRATMPADAEFQATERTYGGREAYDRARAGGRTKLNYRQWVQVRTPKFKEWFGDWETAKESLLIGVDESRGRHLLSTTDRSNSGRGERQEASDVILFNTEALRNVSKAVDPETGEPLAMYHGTGADFSEFRPGGKTGGIFFTSNAQYASDVAATTGWGSGDNVMPVYLSAQNPAVVSDTDYSFDAIMRAKEDGHDSLISKRDDGSISTAVVFSPGQVKSATGNNGAFDPAKPDIRESRDSSQHSYTSDGIVKMSLSEIGADETASDHDVRVSVERIAREWYANKPPVPVTVNSTNEVVFVGWSSARHILRDGNPDRNTSIAVLHMEDLIRSAEYVGFTPDYKGRKDPRGADLYVSEAEIDGILYGVQITVRVHSDGDRYYDHIVLQKKGPAGLQESGEMQASAATPTPPYAGLDSNIANKGADGNRKTSESRADQKPLNAQQKHTLNVVQKTADKFRAEYAGAAALDIRVVYSRDEIPARYRPSPYAEGVYHDREGIIYLVASNLPTRQRSWQVLMHEVVGHYGLANMMGDKFAGLQATVLKMAATGQALDHDPQPGEKNYETVEAVRRLYPEASDSEVAQEVLARMAETMPTTNWFRMAMARIGQWLKNAAKAFGLAAEPTMADVRQLVELAGYHVRSGANLESAPTGQDVAFASQRAESRAAVIDRAGAVIDQARTAGRKLAGRDAGPAATAVFPDLDADQQAFLGKIGGGKTKAADAIRSAFDRAGLKIRQGLVDRYAALKELDEKAVGEDFINTAITDSSWVLAKMSSAGAGALNAMMNVGRISFDAKQKVITLRGDPDGGLISVFKKLGPPAELERFFGWVAANRAEKLMAEGREHLFTADEIAAGKRMNMGKTDDGKARTILYAQVFAEFNKFRDDVVAIAEQTGVLSAEERAMWKDEFYVPFYRVMDEEKAKGPGGSKGLSRQEAYKKLKGGKQNLNDLMENTLMNFHHLLSASLKNQAAVQAIRNAEKAGIARKVPESRRDTATSTFVLEGGNRVFYEVDDPLVFESITSLSDPGLNNMAVRVMSAFKRMFTNMTTVTPQFVIANTFRDLLQAAATSPTSKNVAKNAAQGIRSYRDEKTRAEMLAAGGAFSFGHIYGMDTDEIRASLRKNVAGANLISDSSMVPDILRQGWRKWNDMIDTSENITRAATYVQNVEQMGRLRAAFEARDIMDFSQHGAWPATRFLIRVVPFLNARLQGLDKLYRSGAKPMLLTAMGKGTATDKQAAARFASVTGALVLASLALYMANADDDEYQKLEEWQKDTYWFFRIGDNAFFLPKPFEVGAVATMAERIAQQFMDDKATGELFKERMWDMLMQTFAFNPAPQLFQPMIDVYSNKDAFTGRDIETMGMERLSKGLRARDTTTAAAQAVSAASRVFGDDLPFAVSPVQADHLIRGYFGTVGAQAAGMIDTIWRTASGEEAPSKAWSEYQPIKRFYRDLDVPVAHSRYSTLFYDGLREANRVYADVMELQKLGRFDDARALSEEKSGLLAMRQAMNRDQRRLGDINKRIQEVRRSDRDGDQKRQEIDRLTVEKNLITERIGRQVEDVLASK